MSGVRWTEWEREQLRKMVERGLPISEMSALLPPRSDFSVYGEIGRLGLLEELKIARELRASRGFTVETAPADLPGAAPQSGGAHAMPDLGLAEQKQKTVFDWLDCAAVRNQGHEASDSTDHKCVTIRTDQPIAVMKSADWHFGGVDVDYAAMREHFRFLFDVPNMYMQTFGDDLDLMVTHKVVAARHGCFSTEEQIAFKRRCLKESIERGKLLAVGWGNHDDEFLERVAGFSLTKLLTDGKVPYFRGIGKLDLVVGEQTYRIGFAHKSRFHSFMNPLHGNKRMEQLHVELFGHQWGRADIYVTAHTHYPAISCEGALPEERTWFVKTGTFKTDDLYSQRYWGQGRIGVPTIVYHPDRHEAVGFPTPFEAYRYMNGRDWEGAC